jgi:hypothetical protein
MGVAGHPHVAQKDWLCHPKNYYYFLKNKSLKIKYIYWPRVIF